MAQGFADHICILSLDDDDGGLAIYACLSLYSTPAINFATPSLHQLADWHGCADDALVLPPQSPSRTQITGRL
jgi:hypothetical protein